MRVSLMLAVAGVLAGGAGIKHIKHQPDLSAPKTTIQSFLDAYTRRDGGAMAKCVEGGVSSDIAQDMLTTGIPITSAKGKDSVSEINGDTAKIAFEYEATLSGGAGAPNSVFSFVDMFTLKKESAGWLIVPITLPSDVRDAGTPLITRPLQMMAAVLGPDPGYRNALHKGQLRATEVACLSNTKQLALGVLMYVQDYDERMPRSAAAYHNLIMPYIKNEDVFRCALDAKGTISYSMNYNLQNRTLADIPAPAQTVLLYEGKEGKLNFRHDGKAAVAFADGHAKLMTEAEAKSLIWTLPAPKKTPAKKSGKGK